MSASKTCPHANIIERFRKELVGEEEDRMGVYCSIFVGIQAECCRLVHLEMAGLLQCRESSRPGNTMYSSTYPT